MLSWITSSASGVQRQHCGLCDLRLSFPCTASIHELRGHEARSASQHLYVVDLSRSLHCLTDSNTHTVVARIDRTFLLADITSCAAPPPAISRRRRALFLPLSRPHSAARFRPIFRLLKPVLVGLSVSHSLQAPSCPFPPLPPLFLKATPALVCLQLQTTESRLFSFQSSLQPILSG